jgi:hypothetical protein
VEGGEEGGHSDKVVAMFTPVEQAADNMTRGGGGGGWVRRAGSRQHEKRGEGADNARQEGSGQHNKRVLIAVVDVGGSPPCKCSSTLTCHVSVAVAPEEGGAGTHC